ncbi:MAG: FUSC family protein [Williamsia sp.]|nr:FUSC family protein [Williamsia sp.]
MDYIKAYKSFINSHYLSEGIRQTAGILLPALTLSLFDQLNLGIAISSGALSVCVTDSSGPIQHRRSAMLACSAAVFLVALAVGFSMHSPVLLGIVLSVFCFFFSMLGVYGARVGLVGTGALLTMVLNLSHPREGWDIVWNALYLLAGGLWYTGFSLLLYKVRPYKVIQQALGDCIQQIAAYLRIRAAFYDQAGDHEANYRFLMHEQVVVQEKQTLLGEMLFKTRSIVKESTHISRILLMIYLDAVDLFESVMTSYQDYETLHNYFDKTGILHEYKKLALSLADRLDEIGLAVKMARPSVDNNTLQQEIKELKERHDQLRKDSLSRDNVEGFISLRGILNNIQDIADRLNTLHHYTTYDRKLSKREAHKIDYNKFTDHQEIKPEILYDNINLQSGTFRHALRVTIAVFAGYLFSLFFPIGHSYWILLTIIVIIKPAYSLTKQRNGDRLIGTVCGVLIGVIILHFVHNTKAVLAIMIVLMALSYTFIRKRYLVGVLFMTPYVILFFHLLNPNDFRSLLLDRVIDTAIGSAIAFVASIFLVPAWEHTTIKTYMIHMLEHNAAYLTRVIKWGEEKTPAMAMQARLARKDALVALANLSDAFNRMLSEPVWKQKGIEQVHRFVVLNHMLTSHIATLSYQLQKDKKIYPTDQFASVYADIYQYFLNSIEVLQHKPESAKGAERKNSLRLLNSLTNDLLDKRKTEIEEGQFETTTKKSLLELKSVVDQFNFIYRIVNDIKKIVRMSESLS